MQIFHTYQGFPQVLRTWGWGAPQNLMGWGLSQNMGGAWGELKMAISLQVSKFTENGLLLHNWEL